MPITDEVGHVLSNSPKMDSDWLKSKSLQAKFHNVLENGKKLADFEEAALRIIEDTSFCGYDPLVSEQGCGKCILILLMAQWVDMKAQKSRAERMSVRDHPTLG